MRLLQLTPTSPGASGFAAVRPSWMTKMALLPNTLTTTRLQLRRYAADQDSGWYTEMALKNRAHLARYESGNAAMRITSLEQAHIVLSGFAEMANSGRAAFLGAFRRDTGVFIGQIYVGVGNSELPGYLLGYFADVDHLRQGYISEAAAATVKTLFETCGAERVGLGCDDTNIASQRVAEKLGMVREGHIRADKRNADGTVTGSLLYGLLRSDFAVQ